VLFRSDRGKGGVHFAHRLERDLAARHDVVLT